MYVPETSEWSDLDDYFTLVVITNSGRVAMGTKTRGHGKNHRVLPGGKEWYRTPRKNLTGIQLDSPLIGSTREVYEEAGISILPHYLCQVGLMNIFTEEGDERTVAICKGEADSDFLRDSRELVEVQWVDEDKIPFDQTPADYKYWLPSVLSGLHVDMHLEVTAAGDILDGRVAEINPTNWQRSSVIAIP